MAPSEAARGRACVTAARAAVLCGLLGLASGAHAQEPAETERRFRVLGPSFVAIVVRDDSAAAQWYRRVLGVTQTRHLTADDGRYSIRLLTGQGITLELLRLRDALGPPDPHLGLFKAGFYVDDVEAAWRWLRTQGVDTDRAIFTDEALNARSFVFRDPEGNRLQVFQRCTPSCDP